MCLLQVCTTKQPKLFGNVRVAFHGATPDTLYLLVAKYNKATLHTPGSLIHRQQGLVSLDKVGIVMN